jgi:hypothetical protein
LSFGNFTANNNILTIVNSDEDMILATSGRSPRYNWSAMWDSIKPMACRLTSETDSFEAQEDGQITIFVPLLPKIPSLGC